MRIAIPTFGNDVSPRFCFAPDVLVVELEGRREVLRTTVPLGEATCPDRLRVLASRGVTLLVCGGFNSAFLADAERAGVHVVWGVNGSVDDAVSAVLAGKYALPSRHPNCWCHAQSAGAQPKPPNHCRRQRRRAGHP